MQARLSPCSRPPLISHKCVLHILAWQQSDEALYIGHKSHQSPRLGSAVTHTRVLRHLQLLLPAHILSKMPQLEGNVCLQSQTDAFCISALLPFVGRWHCCSGPVSPVDNGALRLCLNASEVFAYILQISGSEFEMFSALGVL
eukprot:s3031_g9.t1